MPDRDLHYTLGFYKHGGLKLQGTICYHVEQTDWRIKFEKKKTELLVRERVYKRVKMDIKPKREGALIPLEVEHLKFSYPDSPLLVLGALAVNFIKTKK